MPNKHSDAVLGQYSYAGLHVMFVCNADETVFQVMKAEQGSAREQKSFTLLHSGDKLGPAMDVFEKAVQDAIYRTSNSMVSSFMQQS